MGRKRKSGRRFEVYRVRKFGADVEIRFEEPNTFFAHVGGAGEEMDPHAKTLKADSPKELREAIDLWFEEHAKLVFEPIIVVWFPAASHWDNGINAPKFDRYFRAKVLDGSYDYYSFSPISAEDRWRDRSTLLKGKPGSKEHRDITDNKIVIPYTPATWKLLRKIDAGFQAFGKKMQRFKFETPEQTIEALKEMAKDPLAYFVAFQPKKKTAERKPKRKATKKNARRKRQ